jgi:hypothetical protein
MTMTSKTTLPFTIEVERERETRWMVCFKERIAQNEQPRLGTVYVNKGVVGNLQRLTITVADGDAS